MMPKPHEGDAARTVLRAPELDVSAWKNVLIFTWRGNATVELIHTAGPIVEARYREVGRMSVVSLVAHVVEWPDDARRQAYKDFTAAHGTKFAHSAIVLEGKSFLASAVRALSTGLLMVTRQRYIVNVMNTIDDVVRWLPPKHAASTGVVLDPAELKQVLVAAIAGAGSGPL